MSVESTFHASNKHNNNNNNRRRAPALDTVDEEVADPASNTSASRNPFDSSISDFLSMVQACPRPRSRFGDAEVLTTPPDSPKKLQHQHQPQRKRSLSRVTSSPSISSIKESQSVPVLDLQKQSPVAIQKKKARMRHSISAPILNKEILFGGASASTSSNEMSSTDKFANTHPQDYLKSILKMMGISAGSRPALSVDDFFLPVLPENVQGYGPTIITAIREEDLDTLGRIRDAGGTLQCCNKFGESIVHMACRRGSLTVLHYLMRNGVSIRLIDDYGRYVVS